MKQPAKHKSILANGRNSKRLPSFDQWHCRIFPKDMTYPAWRDLTKTATDVANICRAKNDHAAHVGNKTPTGRPCFEFTAKEAESTFLIPRPTFSRAIKELIACGFIEVERHGGTLDGKGIAALYRLSDSWKGRDRRPRDNSNIMKAREARKTRGDG